MPKKPNKQPGDLINIENVKEARQLISDIVNLMMKLDNPSTSASNWLKTLDLFNEKYKKLLLITNKSNKEIEGVYNNIHKDLEDQLNDIAKIVDATEDYFELQVSIGVETQNRIEQQKQEKELKKQSLSLEKQLKKEAQELAKNKKEGNWSTNLLNRIQSKEQHRIDANNKKILDNIYQQAFAKYGEITEDNYEDIKEEIEKGIKNANFDDFNLKTKAFGKAVDTLQEGANELEKLGQNILSKFFSAFTGGISDQANVYNSTYGELAARAGITNRDQYYNAWSSTANTIRDNGLIDNVGVASVQRQWSELAKTGMNQADIFASAMDEVITEKIVPYLDTTSTSFNLLNKKLDYDFVKDIRGINKANLQIAGNNYVTQELLQQLIDEVQPMSDEAIENLAQGSAEFTSMINELTPIMGADAAKSYATQLYKTQKYSNQIAKNGSVSERLALYNAMSKGINIYDPTQYNDFAGTAVDVTQMLTSMMPGFNSTTSGLQTNIMSEAWGETYGRVWGAKNLSAKGLTGSLLAANSNLTPKELEELNKEANKELVNGVYNTEKEMQELTMANLSTEFSQIDAKLGLVGDALVDTVNNIATKIIGAIGTGKVIDILSKISGPSGVILGTIGATVAAVAIANAVSKGITESQKAQAAENAASYSSDYITGYGDATSAGAVSSYAQQLGRDKDTSKWKAGLWDNLGRNFLGSIQTNPLWTWYDDSDPAKYNKDKWDNTFAVINGKYTSEEMEWIIAAYAAAIMDAGNNKSIISSSLGSGITIDGIKAFLHQKYSEDVDGSNKMFQKAVNILALEDLYPVGPHKKYSDLSWGQEELQSWGMYRSGLNYVPYDNYPAYLHEGEAVLTAATASELRALVDEYRATNSQSIRFDVIIQEQTNALIGEMERIISVMNTSASPSLTNRLTSKVRESMRDMRSTSSF